MTMKTLIITFLIALLCFIATLVTSAYFLFHGDIFVATFVSAVSFLFLTYTIIIGCIYQDCLDECNKREKKK